MNKCFFLVVVLLTVLCYSKPMESITNYNVIMVHGAADSGEGIKSDLCGGDSTYAPYAHYGTIFDAGDMMGVYKDNGDSYNLLYFLDSAILENVSF